MQEVYPNLMSDRLNTEARLMAGCTLKEILVLFMFNLLILSLICLVLGAWVFKKIWVGLALIFLSLVPCLSFSMVKLGKLKKNRPLFYARHYTRRLFYSYLGLQDDLALTGKVYRVHRELM